MYFERLGASTLRRHQERERYRCDLETWKGHEDKLFKNLSSMAHSVKINVSVCRKKEASSKSKAKPRGKSGGRSSNYPREEEARLKAEQEAAARKAAEEEAR